MKGEAFASPFFLFAKVDLNPVGFKMLVLSQVEALNPYQI